MTAAQPSAAFTPPLHLQAFEYIRPMVGGTTGPLLVGARTPDGPAVRVILKLRQPSTPYGQGHFGGTTLACEFVCASIARALGLKVPDYGIVDVGPIFANGIGDDAVSRLLASNLGPNFGSVLLDPMPVRWNSSFAMLSFELRQAIDDVLCFDNSVLNADRTRSNPNLFWDGADGVYVIDHGLACYVHQMDAAAIATSPLLPEERIKAHCGFDFLHRKGSGFHQVPELWRVRLDGPFWSDLRAAIPAQWQTRAGDLDKIFEFLENRVGRMDAVRDDLRRVVQ